MLHNKKGHSPQKGGNEKGVKRTKDHLLRRFSLDEID